MHKSARCLLPRSRARALPSVSAADGSSSAHSSAKSRNRPKQRKENELEKTFKHMFKMFEVQWIYTSISYGKRALHKKHGKKLPVSFYDTRNPMNMAAIQKNLQSGKYKQLREVVADFHLMFDTGTLINRKLTSIFKSYSKCYQVFKRFVENIDRKIHLPSFCRGRNTRRSPAMKSGSAFLATRRSASRLASRMK